VAQADRIFDDNFLAVRAKLIEVAAILDRIDRAATASVPASSAGETARPPGASWSPAFRLSSAGETAQPPASPAPLDDPRRARVEEAIGKLLSGASAPGQRAATLQQLFSRPYEADWRERFGL